MGKVSILKSFSLAALALCMVGYSVSPASAAVKRATSSIGFMKGGSGAASLSKITPEVDIRKPVFGNTSQPCEGIANGTCNSHSDCQKAGTGGNGSAGSCNGKCTTTDKNAVGSCYECHDDGDCSGSGHKGTHCLTSGSSLKYTCQQCLNNSHCTSNNAPICDSYTCRSPKTNAECAQFQPSTPYYNANTGVCAKCVSNSDCSSSGSNKICNTANGTCRYPQNESECQTAFGNHWSGSTCVQCAQKSHCASSQVCASYSCRAPQSNSECEEVNSSKPYYNGGTCVECTQNSQCRSGNKRFCRNGTCSANCQSNAECNQAYNSSSYVCY